MNLSARIRFVLPLTAASLLLVTCSRSESPPTATLEPRPILSIPAAPSSTPIPTPTAAIRHVAIPSPGATWNYAVLGDSSAWGFPKFYAQFIEADLGVTVNVKMWAVGGATSADVLNALLTNEAEREDVRNSEVVTFYGNPLHLVGMRITNGYPKDRYDCSPEVVAQYKAELSSIAEEILSLRKGQPTIIRTYARFMPFYRVWRDTGNFDEFRRCVSALDAAIFEVGKEHNILVADTGVAMNGPNHDQDPYDKGYLRDGVHENDEGALIVADVFRKLGYDPIIP